MKFLIRKIGGIWLMLLFMAGALMGLWPNKADSLAFNSHHPDFIAILAFDTAAADTAESEDDDDDEWEA